jgi:multidrug resistance efflux pump
MNRFTTQKIARFSIIVTISALMMFTLIKSSSHNANAVDQKNGQAISVTALRVQESSLPIRMTFSGPVVGRDEVPIYSELSQGLIDKVLVEAGQHVKAGTVLAMIDASALRIQKTQQQANLQRAGVAIKQQENSLEDAQTQYEQAQIERKRADQVAESGLISKEIREQRVMAEQLARTRVQTMKNNLGMAQADFNLASAQLAETDLHLNQTSIRSPIPGMVVERKVHTGMSLAQNTEPLFNILRDDDLEVELEVSADDATRLKLGMPVTIQLLNDMNEVKANKNGEVEAVLDQVEAWSSAWKTKDINAYLNFYSSDFVSEQKLSKSAWLKQRRNRFASKDILNIELSKINVQVTGDKAIVEFLQNYIANGKKDESNKRLTLSFKDGLWLIVREQTIPHLGNVKLSSSQEKTSQQANIFNGKVCRAYTN